MISNKTFGKKSLLYMVSGKEMGYIFNKFILPLYSRERAPDTHWIGGWVGPNAALDAERTIPPPVGNRNPIPSVVQPLP
jgi:hypothetical protein